ncbi:MAG: 1,2-diacylglycerol 3-glucosyltransferase [Oscillospiraceae bacterium]|nr:1,2-diacylglycerol 3-glucosyltransferase [Oscillospiraceae bacterium]
MRILILTGKFGMGHWSASCSLYDQLSTAFPDSEITVEDLPALALPSASKSIYRGFYLLVNHGTSLYNFYYQATENGPFDVLPPLAPLLKKTLNNLLEKSKPDGIIATHPICAQLVSRWKQETGSTLPLVTCITDLSPHAEWLCQGTDCYMAGSFDLRDALMKKGIPKEKILVSGIPVKNSFHATGSSKGGGPRRLLIMGGGMGVLPKRTRFYEELNQFPNLETTVMTANNKRLYEKFAGKFEHIEFLGYTDKVYDYMAQADMVFTKPGGITLFESIFSALPMLAWEPFWEQEMHNADFLVAKDLGRVAPKELDGSLESIRALIYDTESLARMSANMISLAAQLQNDGAAELLASLTHGELVRGR